MQAFSKITSGATVFVRDHVDTDLIIPAKHLKTVSRQGLGRFAFESLRYHPNAELKNDSPFDGPALDNQILIAGDNFGCGSSREHAVWALMDLGYRVVIAPSFADIFRTNSVRNGLLTIEMDADMLEIVSILARTGLALTVDLASQTLSALAADGMPFDYPAEAKTVLLEGLDEIAATMDYDSAIVAHESRQRAETPWLVS